MKKIHLMIAGCQVLIHHYTADNFLHYVTPRYFALYKNASCGEYVSLCNGGGILFPTYEKEKHHTSFERPI